MSPRSKDELAWEYAHLRAYGLSHAQIAERLGIQLPTLLVALGRNRVVYIPLAHEKEFIRSLESAIRNGQPFTTYSLAGGDLLEPGVASFICLRYVHMGRIEKVGTKKNWSRQNVVVYRACEKEK